MSKAYKNAGVNIDAGNKFVDLIKPAVKSTHRRGVMTDIGGFGGLFSLDIQSYPKPVLVSGTDGVGTKLFIAKDSGDLSTIGIDLVAMCINDIACSGAEPLFFLDYFGTGELKPEEQATIVEGIANGCKQSGCALLGGETAELPGLYKKGDFDLAGFAVGVVNEDKIIDGSAISSSHDIIGIASSGFHSNGYSLVRHFLTKEKINLNDNVPDTKNTWKERLLAPTKIYSALMLQLSRNFTIDGFVHVTGGGFWENIPRILPKSVKAVINRSSWEWPIETRIIAKAEGMDEDETLRVFNCGIGLVMFTHQDNTSKIVDFINGTGEKAYVLGKTALREKGEESIVIR